jgi:hypothetical protein
VLIQKVLFESSAFLAALLRQGLQLPNPSESTQSPFPDTAPGPVRGRAQLAVGQHATGEQVVHQAGLDLLVFGDQGFGFFDGGVDAVKDRNDSLLGCRI